MSSRTALVTGASSGIGAAVARTFAKQGWAVALGGRRMEKLEEVAQDVDAAGGRSFIHPLNVRDAASIDDFFGATENALSAPDIVVNNAGLSIAGRIHELEATAIQEDIETNLTGPILVARRALPKMIEAGRGDIVFIGSLNARLPRPYQVGYTASKAGIEGVARNLQIDLEGTGVRSSVIRVGPTFPTDFARNWTQELVKTLLASWKSWGVYRHHQTMDPDDVARAVLNLVNTPPGTRVDLVEINPEDPKPS